MSSGAPDLPVSRATSFTIPGPAGLLECILRRPAGEARAAAAVCHPHPLHGGNLHNKVVYRITAALAEEGFAALRFNFRGVGLSAGSHDEGNGEKGDLSAALDWLAGSFPGLPLLAAGFSFGAWVALRVGAVDDRVQALIGAGLATRHYDLAYLRDCVKPKLFIQGSADELGPLAEVAAEVDRLPPPKELVVVEGADHFFTGRLEPVETAVAAFAARR